MTLARLINLAGSATDEEDPILRIEPPQKDFNTVFTITTGKFSSKEALLLQSRTRDYEIQTLANSPMRAGIRVGTILDAPERRTTNQTAILEQDKKRRLLYENAKASMDNWTIAEDSITIQCRGYVRTVITVALLVVCGGMAIPFSVGSRIRGVDPFQITTFAWLLAGFIAVVAKSRYVNEWPWHDFFHGHVVCRSIKDVCDVTGLDPQLVLAYLLLEEKDTTLRARGPYNGMFSRVSKDGTGFAIDEPAKTSTMLESGFIVLKVLNAFGEHLVCLDARYGTDSAHLGQPAERIVCRGLEAYDKEVSGQDSRSRTIDGLGSVTGRVRNSNKVKKLIRTKFLFDRVLGVYVADSRFG